VVEEQLWLSGRITLAKKIHQYRPQRTSPETLEAILVAREKLLQKILGQLSNWTPGTSRQHYLLIGPRGIGKTHLLSLVAHRILKQPSLYRKWCPLTFPEESYGITRISDLFIEALRILSGQTGDKEITSVYHEVVYEDNDEKVMDLSLDALRRFHKYSGRGILFLMENVNRIFERQIKEKTHINYFRKILIEEEWLVTICTSPTYLNSVTKEEEPLFEFFQVIFLPELTPQEQIEMLNKLAKHEENHEFQKYLRKHLSRLRALYHFTGGNPRLTIMLYDLISYQAITDVQAELDGLLDKITPFYQDRMKDIGEQGGKLIETMSLMPEGCTPTELARESRMEAKTVRAVLQRLNMAGYVSREQRRQKKTVYIIPERLFRIWHQMNHSRSGRGLILYLLEFFSTWYESKEERDKAWDEITGKMKNRTYDDKDDDTNDDLSEYLEYLIAVSEGSEKYEREFDRLRKLEHLRGMDIGDKELRRLDEMYKTHGDYFLHKGFFLLNVLRNPNGALNAFSKASQLKPDDMVPIFNKAIVLEILGRRTYAKKLFDQLLNNLTTYSIYRDNIETHSALLRVLKEEKRPYAVKMAAYLFQKTDHIESIREIALLLQSSKEDWRRQHCATALGKIGSEKAVNPLITALQDEASNVRGSAATALGRIGSEKAVDPLITALQDEASNVRGSATLAIGHIASERPLVNLRKVMGRISELMGKESIILSQVVRAYFKTAFSSGKLAKVREAIESAKINLKYNDMFFIPYNTALKYLESDRDPAIIERQHPEMRDAVQLLVKVYDEGND